MDFRKVTFVIVICMLSHVVRQVDASYDYGAALDLCFRFFEAQRSGPLPSDQRERWRGDSGLNDGHSQGVDLVGGYYDGGDHVKYQLPMAFTITMLSWSIIEYQKQLQQHGQLSYALDAIRWGTDYFIKAHSESNVLWVEVGDGQTDHDCWQRPEDMTTSRQAYKVDTNNPGSDVAGETAAAMAAASIAFRNVDVNYSETLLIHAKELFTFADNYKGNYDNSVPIVKQFYPSGQSGYADELLWAALWLYKATTAEYYLDYACNNGPTLGGTTSSMTLFTWSNKYAGVQVLASKLLLEHRDGRHTDALQAYLNQAFYFMCATLAMNNGQEIQRTRGGLLYTTDWNNVQYVTSATFLMTVFADYLDAAKEQLSCSGGNVDQTQLLHEAQTQVDYLLGNNPRGRSYMVGFGSSYSEYVHHRGSSIPSISTDPTFVSCEGGKEQWYNSPRPNVNVLAGALVSPDQDDNFIDSRSNYVTNEATIYNSGPLVGPLARFA